MRLVTRLAAVAMTCLSGGCGSSPAHPDASLPVPNYAGKWSGSFLVVDCAREQGTINVCGVLLPIGRTAPISLDLHQSDAGVRGEIEFPEEASRYGTGRVVTVHSSAPPGTEAPLSLSIDTGCTGPSLFGSPHCVEYLAWASTLPAADRMEGTFRARYAVTGLEASAVQTRQLVDVRKLVAYRK